MVPVTHFPSPSAPTYETPSARMTLRSDGVLHGIAKPVALSEEHLRDNLRLRETHLQGRRVPIVLDVRELVELTREARRFYSSPECTASCSALAIVVSPGFNRIIGNLLAAAVVTGGRSIPTEVFDDEEEALAWAVAQAGPHT